MRPNRHSEKKTREKQVDNEPACKLYLNGKFMLLFEMSSLSTRCYRSDICWEATRTIIMLVDDVLELTQFQLQLTPDLILNDLEYADDAGLVDKNVELRSPRITNLDSMVSMVCTSQCQKQRLNTSQKAVGL